MRFYKPQGLNLPTLTNPATTKNIAAGMEAIDASGVKMTGRLVVDKVWTKRGETPANLKASTPPDNPNGPVHLSFAESIGNATAADILQGKTALTDDGKITGTLEMTGGEPSYTLKIKTDNMVDGTDQIIYYAPGDSMKTELNLTTSYQSITCGDFICINRGSTNNAMPDIVLYTDTGYLVLSIDPGSPSHRYAVDLKANGGYTTLNIGAIMRDFPTATKIALNYMPS